MAGSARVLGHRDYVIKVLLHGLTGPIDGTTYGGGVMVPMNSNTDQWVSDVANYVRNAFGNSALFITPEQVAAVRKSTTRRQPWTMTELLANVTTELTDKSAWKVSASHNAAALANAINGTGALRWTTDVPQAPEMWFQVELPQPTSLTEIHLEAQVAGGRGGGRGALPAGPPAGYRVQVSMDGTTWGPVVAQGAGANPTVITFAPVQARFVRITQTGTAATGWAIQRVRLYRSGQGR
jgi:hypothetical protein